MDASRDLDACLARLGRWTPEEQIEELLKLAAGVIASFDQATLVQLRAHLVETQPEGPPKQTLIEIIEGQLASLDVIKDARWEKPPTLTSINFCVAADNKCGAVGPVQE